ncbi:MAG: STAS domain-containing protein [Ignavibacteriales bacterium]|nr:STAS domain-containing protein [Ignavibacteriales bacterium]
MEFTAHQQGDVAIVVLHGELDVALAPRLKALLKDTIEQGNKKIVVDMKNVLFVDSSCLGVMVNAHKLAVSLHAAIKFAQSSEQVRKIFELTRTDKHLSFHATIDEAIKSFES